MPRKFIFLHNLESSEIYVISIKTKKDWIGKYIHHNFYKMFYSKHKGFICNCDNNVFKYSDNLCIHRKTFLKLFLDIKHLPIASILETINLKVIDFPVVLNAD